MIHHQFIANDTILEVTPEKPLEKKDFHQLADVVDRHVAEHGPLRGLMISTPSFPGWQDFGAMVSHAKFVRNHHKDITRVAAVSDSGFLKIMPMVADHFTKADVRHFQYDEKQKALGWLKS